MILSHDKKMKTHLISAGTVISLLAASALCVGTRYTADQRRNETSAASRAKGPTKNAVDSGLAPAPREEAFRRQAGPQTLASRLRSALATTNSSDRTRTLLAMTEGFTAEDWPAVMAALVEIGMTAGGSDHQLLLAAWAEKNVDAAIAWAGNDVPATMVVMRAWLGRDPDAALSYLLSPEGKRTSEWNLLMARVVEDLARDTSRLARTIGGLSERERRIALQQARPVFPAENAEAVGKWLEAFDPALRGELLALRMKGLSFEGKTALAHAFPNDLGPRHFGALYQEWVAVDKEAASTALRAMGPGNIQKAAYNGVVIGLFQKQRMAEAVEAFRAYPEYASEQMLGELLLYFNVKDAELLMSLVPEIKNPDLKLARYRELLHEWLQADAPAARKWMEENEVPEQVRRELAKP
jgi:hypothetical protein